MVTGRMGRPGTWGDDGTRERTSEANWRKPVAWNRRAGEGLLPSGAENRDGHRPRVFCASLADAFEPRPELERWRFDLFELIAATPNLDWLLLTKRPEEARDWMRAWYEDPVGHHEPGRGGTDALFRMEGDENWSWRDGISWGALPNVWIGASIENARHAFRADVLREIPAPVRFVSAEPLLGSLLPVKDPDGLLPWEPAVVEYEREKHRNLSLAGIDWLIVGGESGSRSARPMHPGWARELRQYCRAQRGFPEGGADLGPGGNDPGTTAFFFKQFGAWAPAPDGRLGRDLQFVDGGPGNGIAHMEFMGTNPKSGGKLLDGVEWCEFPEPGLVPA